MTKSSRGTVRRLALLRSVNVGRARRLAMADLRALLLDLGCSDVRTLLNSGNAVFVAPHDNAGALRRAIEAALETHCGFAVPTVVLSAGELDSVVVGNTLLEAGDDPSRFLAAFVDDPAVLASAKPLLHQGWEPETLALGDRAAYLHCPGGIAGSELVKAFTRATGAAATTRNWSTVLKLQTAAAAPADPD